MTLRIITKSIWQNPGNRGHRLQRSVRALGWQFWKRVIRTPRTILLPNGRVFVAHPDCVVSSSLIYSKFPEFHELQLVRKTLRQSDMVLDIGANVGHIGLLLSDVVSPDDILAFEPTPLTFARLCENWKANQFPTRGLQHVAIGAETGTARFPDLTHPGTMNAQIMEGSDSDQRTIEVRLTPLDSYRHLWNGKTVGFLKIDVEGHEAAVFRGATRTLHEDRPRLIMFESLDHAVDAQVNAVLSSADYRLFQLDKAGRPTTDSTINQNLFATPSECFDRIANA